MSSSFATPWTIARQAPLSVEFSRQEYRSGLPFSSPEAQSLTQGLNSCLLHGRQILYYWATREALLSSNSIFSVSFKLYISAVIFWDPSATIFFPEFFKVYPCLILCGIYITTIHNVFYLPLGLWTFLGHFRYHNVTPVSSHADVSWFLLCFAY